MSATADILPLSGLQGDRSRKVTGIKISIFLQRKKHYPFIHILQKEKEIQETVEST